MLTDTITAVYVPHYITWNDHRSAEQIQDFIANCVHSACVFIERGEQKEPTWKSYQTNFFGRQIQQIGYMKNAHKFYVANPQNPSVDVWFTRDQRANFHNVPSDAKISVQQRCPTLLVEEEKLAYQWLLNKQPPAFTSCHIVPTHFHIPPILPKFHFKTRYESFKIKHTSNILKG